MDYIDLHTHTTYSDGTMTPQELIKHAKDNNIKAIAITDHDTIEGVDEAIIKGLEFGIEVIPGIEISVEFKKEMHFLGYFLSNDYNEIKPILKKLKESRNERNPKIAKKLNEIGIDITMKEVEEAANNNVVGRPHFAIVMMKKGYVKSINEAFNKYLKSGAIAYFKKEIMSPKEGIVGILKANGIPVLAHPKHLRMGLNEMDSLIKELAGYGLMGIEAYYTNNLKVETKRFLKLANKHDLLISGGSDFHGKNKPQVKIGTGLGNLRIPYDLLEKMRHKK